MPFVYIAASRSRTLYIRVARSVQARMWQHKNKILDGFSARYNINRLVYYEQYDSIKDAINREKQLKRWSRAKKLWLIERANPTWLDLCEGWYDEAPQNAGPSTRGATARKARRGTTRAARSE
jgi:putative endonuclease